VIEVGRLPGGGGVARIARLRESVAHVIRVRGVVEIGQVAGDARSAGDVVAAKFGIMAIGAGSGWISVHSRERPAGAVVIELRVAPLHGIVAAHAVCRVRGEQFGVLQVRRIGGVVVVSLVAGDARGISQIVVVVLVAVVAGAGRIGVCPSQNEAGQRVIELGVYPAVGAMAALAGLSCEEGGRRVFRIRGAVEVCLMATDALRGHEVEIGESTALMTIIAGRGSMSTGEREAIHVHVDLRSRNFPAADRVTAFASARHLAAVDVSMAVGALIADIREHHLGMAIYAVDALVQAAKRKLRLVVVELRHRANRLPSVHGVAVLTSDIQVAVGAARLLWRLRRGSASGRRQQQPQDHPFSDQTWNQFAHPKLSGLFKSPWKAPIDLFGKFETL